MELNSRIITKGTKNKTFQNDWIESDYFDFQIPSNLVIFSFCGKLK